MEHNKEFQEANEKIKQDIIRTLLTDFKEIIDIETDCLILTEYDDENDIAYYDKSPIESIFILNLYKELKSSVIHEDIFETKKYTFIINTFSADPVFVFIAECWNLQKDYDLNRNIGISIVQQEKIECDEKLYIVDFLFRIHENVKIFNFYDANPPAPIIKLCVEFDGHEFHEKTKEQARHDKQRDRDIKSAGYEIIHFTGSEVYQDWKSVLNRILDILFNLYIDALTK